MTRALFVLAVLAPAAEAQQPVAFTDVRVVDVAAGQVRPATTVVVTGNRVTAVGAGQAVPAGARRIDGQGKYLIPGLWDMHVHLSMAGREALPVLLANGVTAVRDMGGSGPTVMAWRDSVAAGSLVGPRIKAPGRIVESARWLNAVIGRVEPLNQPALLTELRNRFAIDSAPDGPRIVDSLRRLGADFIKIRNFPSPAAYFPFARAAREAGLPVAGHGPPAEFLGIVSDSGFASFEHSLIAIRNARLAPALSTMPDSAQRALIQRLARNGTAWNPTLVSGRVRFIPDSAKRRMIDDSTGASDPRLRFVSPTLRQEWRAGLALEGASQPDDWGAVEQEARRSVRRFADLGVTLLAGTDLGVITLVPGFALHDELEMLADAGLTPREVLAAATINPARVMGLSDSMGTIAPGQAADLLLLDTNPLEDIRATRAIRGVMANGRWYDRAALDRLLK
ncbi:MAG TPA: amidohydrolase family protein [Gemmatimonadales bacterium]